MAEEFNNDYLCNTCIYRCWSDMATGNSTCDYMLITGERRGCKGGNDCTKYEKGDKKKRINRLKYAKVR